MGIEKGRPSEQSPKMKGIFYEAMQEKKLSESPKPLILLGFSKSSVSPLAPEIRWNRLIPADYFWLSNFDPYGKFSGLNKVIDWRRGRFSSSPPPAVEPRRSCGHRCSGSASSATPSV